MKPLFVFIFLLLLSLAPLPAGIVYEIETTDHSASPPRSGQSFVSIEGRLLKFEEVRDAVARSSVIFRGDRREMVMVEHDKKTYMVMDEQSLQKASRQMSDAHRQIQEQLAKLPKEQREMAERMMKGQLPQAPSAKLPVRQVRNTGERATHNGYPCVRYDILQDGEKVQEMWVTNWSNIPGGGDVQEVFLDMAAFYRQLFEDLPMASSMGDNPFSELSELEGFPVVTRTFENGKLEEETQLRSSDRRRIDPAEFEPPAGYKRRSMF